MATWIPIILSGCSLILGLCVAIVAWIGQGKRNVEDSEVKASQIRENLITVSLKIDSLDGVCRETRADVKAIDNKIQNIDKRVTILERDQKTLWRELEELKNTNSAQKQD